MVTVPLSGLTPPEVVNWLPSLIKIPASRRCRLDGTAANVADERTNAVLVSGEPNSRRIIAMTIKQLDRQQAVQNTNSKVIYLKYAKPPIWWRF